MSVTPNKSGPGSPANLPPSRQRFGRGLLAAVLIASSGLVAGCANFDQDSTATGSIPDDYRTRHPIVVSESEISEDIVVSTQARTLSPRSAQAEIRPMPTEEIIDSTR